MESLIEIHALGRVELAGTGGEASEAVLRQPKRLALLVHLVLARPHGFQRRDRLLALFWPELDESRARNALGQAIHFLRRQLGPEVIVARERGELGVADGAVRCDALEFERLIQCGDDAAAIDAYRGELLPGFHLPGMLEFERWLETERERLRGAACSAAWRLAEAAEAAANPREAARLARIAVAFEPGDEAGVRRLMGLLDRSGDRAAALRAFDTLARRLADEYGGAPAGETRALAQRLRSSAAGSTPGLTLAVLPFLHLGPATDGEYLADGLTEELIAALAGAAGLRVMSRTSSFAMKGRSAPLRTLAAELGAAYVVEGSVRPTGDGLRVVAQLIDARSDEHLWARTFEAAADLAGARDAIAEGVATALSADEPDTLRRMARRPGADPQAFDLYLRARYYWGQSSQASWVKARTLLEEAAARDPGFALPHAGLADLYLQLPLFHFAPPIPRSEAQARGRTAALRAIELDDDLAEAHTALATARWYDWDWEGAERSFLRAIERNPSYATAHQRYGLCLAFLGRFDEAAERVELAARLDPLSLSAAVGRAVVDLRARRYDDARERLQSVLETDPNFFPALHYMADLEQYTDHFAACLAINLRLGLLTGAEHAELLAAVERGDISAYHRGVGRALRDRDASPTILAAGLSHAGDDAAAWEAIERAFHERDPVLTDGVRVHPGLDRIRRQPRFASLRARMGIIE